MVVPSENGDSAVVETSVTRFQGLPVLSGASGTPGGHPKTELTDCRSDMGIHSTGHSWGSTTASAAYACKLFETTFHGHPPSGDSPAANQNDQLGIQVAGIGELTGSVRYKILLGG